MPNTTELPSATTQDDFDLTKEERQFAPGQIVWEDATNDRVEIDDEGEGDDEFTREEKEEVLKELASKPSQRDLVSRRLQVRDSWKARYFWRGNQRLLSGKNGAWVLPQMVLMGGQSYDDHSQETNMYLAFGDTIVASLTSANPTVRFEPQDATDDADINAAENADKARVLIERSNDMVVVQEDLARYLWTDGVAFYYTRHILDAQRFGFARPESDELSYLPQLGGEGPTDDEEGAPRGAEIVTAYGTLEVKVPIQANKLSDCVYLQMSEETDIVVPKTQYPEKADEITPSAAATAESDYERLARTSIMMGMRPSNMTRDSMTYNTTMQRTWVRPSFFVEQKDKRRREWLYQNFPKGALIIMAGQTFCEARNESMDDHWAMVQSRPGDGMHRPALGTPLIPLQEKLNDCMDLVHESFMHLIPIKWVDSEAIDQAALGDLRSKPNTYLKMKRRVDKELASNFFIEPQVQIADGLLTYIEKLFGEMAQFLCGAFPALFGGNTGSNDTAQGIASQRDQALGRIGLTWRSMRSAYAQMMKQAVTQAAEHRREVMSGTIKGKDGTDTRLAIDPQDLKGNVLCFPDSDENFPESWVAQRMVWMNLLQSAEKNPILGQLLSTPRNQMLAKDKIGLTDLVIPAAASVKKQLGEIMILLQTGPAPNPKLEEAQVAVQQLYAAAQAQGIEPQPNEIAAVQQSISTIPAMVSTVPVGQLDDHATEAAEIRTWANSPDGIRAQAENREGYENVMVHYDEHIAALQQQQAGQTTPEGKPPSESLSMNFKDLPIDGQVQAAAKFNIKLDPAKLAADAEAEKAQKAADARARLQGKDGKEAEGEPGKKPAPMVQ